MIMFPIKIAIWGYVVYPNFQAPAVQNWRFSIATFDPSGAAGPHGPRDRTNAVQRQGLSHATGPQLMNGSGHIPTGGAY